MPAARYETIAHLVSVHAVNCPDPAVIEAIRSACIDFCADTHYLTQDLDPISVVANEAVCSVDVAAGYDVLKVLDPLYFNGRRLPSFTSLGITPPSSWQARTAQEPTCFTCFTPAEIVLYPKPTLAATDAITGRVVLVPSRSSVSTDANLLADYREEIVSGALARVLSIRDQPYTDHVRAKAYAQDFFHAKANAAAHTRAAFVNAPLRVAYPGF